jgi:predicted RNA binding protein YcfA (HicA-like mRNA interferase family)
VPVSFRDLKRAIEAFGCTVEEPSKGSHWKIRNCGKAYTIPAHNGLKTELSDVYVKGVCRALGLSYDELKSRM